MAEVRLSPTEIAVSNSSGDTTFDSNRDNIHIVGSLQSSVTLGAPPASVYATHHYTNFGTASCIVESSRTVERSFDITSAVAGQLDRAILFPYYKVSETTERTGSLGVAKSINAVNTTDWIYGAGGILCHIYFGESVACQQNLYLGGVIATCRIDGSTIFSGVQHCLGGHISAHPSYPWGRKDGQQSIADVIRADLHDGGLFTCFVDPATSSTGYANLDHGGFLFANASEPSYDYLECWNIGLTVEIKIFVGLY